MSPKPLLLPLIMALLLAVSCSTTSHLPEGEVLYTGVDRIDHHKVDTLDASVRDLVAVTLEVAPNSAFLGSAYRMSWLPMGLWIYNGLYTEKEHGLRHWLWSHFKSDPTLFTQVNPKLRAQAAEAALMDEGYFDATVSYDTVYNPKNARKARIAYDVTYRHHSHLGSVRWLPIADARVDSIVHRTMGKTLLKPGERFSASMLEAERQRVATTLQDSGYFFFSPDHIRFLGDSSRRANTVDLRVYVADNNDPKVLKPCVIDSVLIELDHGANLKRQLHDSVGFVRIDYNGPLMVKKQYLKRAVSFGEHSLYRPDRVEQTKALFSRLKTFKYLTTEFQLLDQESDTTQLKLRVGARYALPWQGTTEIGCVYKDNQQVGPGATLTSTRSNLFGGGEQLSLQMTGSYEWRTGTVNYDDGMLNGYELGVKASLTVPRLQLPHFFQPSSEKPVSSTYSVSIDWLRRAHLFEMVRAGGAVEYSFNFDKYNYLTFTPLRLTYVSMLKKTDGFEVILEQFPGLEHSFENQFIPQMQVGFTFDNSGSPKHAITSQYFNATVSEAGGLTDVLMGEFGSHRKQGERQLFFQPFSQFIKGTAEYRILHHLSPRLTFAARLLGGIGYAYGNSYRMPYSEQFFIGGPNSLRGFPIRGIGPGSQYFNPESSIMKYNYIQRVGDLKVEGNAELRFPIAGSLYGALFADAGNIWWLRASNPDIYQWIDGPDEDPNKGEQIGSGNFFRQLALDAGLGLRLDLGMLVLRLDMGAPLHDPNVLGSHYFNRREGFFRHIEYNLAVGYPF